MEQLLKEICVVSNLDAETIKSNSRVSNAVAARVLFCQEALKLKYSKSEIARFLNKNHSSIINLLNNYKSSSYYDSFKFKFYTLFKTRIDYFANDINSIDRCLNIIDTLRNSDELIKEIYLNGSCYQFYLFLKTIYPQAIPYINHSKDHIASKIFEKLFDINGIIEDETEYVLLTKEESDICKSWSFSKKFKLLVVDESIEELISEKIYSNKL